MTHRHAGEEVLSAFVDGETDAEETRLVESAIAECDTCRRLHFDLREAARAVRSLPVGEPGPLRLRTPVQERSRRLPWSVLTSPRLVGVASVAAAVALGWLAAPQVPGLMSGNPATSAGRASKSSSPADYAVATSVKLAGGGELVLSTPRSAYRPGETVPVQLALRGTTLVPGQVTVVAAGPSGSLTVYQSESGGDAPVAIMAVPQSRASGALSSQSQGPSGPRDQDLFDFNWTAASASGQALASGTYQLRARLILSDGETVELSLPVTVSAGG